MEIENFHGAMCRATDALKFLVITCTFPGFLTAIFFSIAMLLIRYEYEA